MEKALSKRSNLRPVVSPATTTPTPIELLQQAITQGLDLDKMEKLMELQERWEKNQAKKSFLDALTTFQSIAPVIPKNRKANINSQKGAYSYKFADLGVIAKTIKPALKECGLSYRWDFSETGGKLKANCHISHRDGHTEITTMEAGMDSSGGKNDIQQKGSTQTYLQRYTLIGGLGLSTADEDNDGRNHQTTTPSQPELSEEEVLGQWQQSVDAITTRVELTSLYMKNKKAVEKNEKIKAIFKARQEQLPPVTKTNLP
jgi:hypothetical protein